jgi:hypothetical protein
MRQLVWFARRRHQPVVACSPVAGSMSCQVKHLTTAEPVAVYDLLMDVERWSDWMPTVSAASWEQPGDPDTGLGVSGGFATGSASHATRSPPERDRIITPTRQRCPVTFPSRTTRVTSVSKSSPMDLSSYGLSRARRASQGLNKLFRFHGSVHVRADSGGVGTRSRKTDRPVESELSWTELGKPRRRSSRAKR